jgi:hypothetical protein
MLVLFCVYCRKILNILLLLRFENLTVVSVVVLWILTPCNVVGSYQCFGGTYHLHLQSTVCNFQTWVISCQINTQVQFLTRPLRISVKFHKLVDLVAVSKNANFSCLLLVVCSRHSVFQKRHFFCMMQLVKIAITLALIEQESSFWAYLKVNEVLVPMRCHTLRFNIDQCQGHQSSHLTLNF